MQRFLSRLALTSSPLTIIFSLLVLGLGVAVSPAEAQISMYKTIGDYPGTTGVTSARAINDAEQIVGTYNDARSNQHGFLLSGSVYSAIDFPGAVNTEPLGINNAGQVVGYYDDLNLNRHGFLLSGGKYSTIDFTGAAGTIANGINNNGAIAGVYWGATTPQYGFLLAAGVFTTIDTFGQ